MNRTSTLMQRGFIAMLFTCFSLPLLAADNEQAAKVSKEKASDNYVRASEIMRGEVRGPFNPIGNVSDLMLTEDGKKIQYILYNTYEPFSLTDSESGFVAADAVAYERSWGPNDLNVRIADEASQQTPDKLTITAREADHRLLSNIIGEEIQFENDASRKVVDVLINRETGAVQQFVVEMNEDSLFNDELRVIPVDQVSIGKQGRVETSAELAEVTGEAQYRADQI